jgi:hypothetical protein
MIHLRAVLTELKDKVKTYLHILQTLICFIGINKKKQQI